MHIRGVEKTQRHRVLSHGVMAALFCLVSWSGDVGYAGIAFVQKQINPMRQDSIKLSSVPEIPKGSDASPDAQSSRSTAQPLSQLPLADGGGGLGYDATGRRDPFAPVILELQPGRLDVNLPPLQRVSLTELNLIAVVWGAYGYTAMVQTAEGNGYSVRRGTRIGQNNGVVTAVTERGIIVQERFTDVYGKKQEREHVKLLHPKEGSE